MSGRLLSNPFLHQGFLAAEQFHGEFVIRGLEQRLQLVFDKTLFLTGPQRVGARLLFGGAIQADIVTPKMYLTTLFIIHVCQRVRKVVGDQEGFVVDSGHQRVSTCVSVLDTDLNRVILGKARLWWR